MQNAQAIKIEKKPVSHHWQGRGGYMPIAIVEHMMQGTLEESWHYFDGKTDEVHAKSAHYGVGRDGRVWQFVEDEDTAWANGVLQYPDLSIEWLKEVAEEQVNCNLVTLAVEYEGFSGQALTEAQYEAALALHRELVQRWEIETDDQHIIGHNRIDSQERANNPGPAFPWSRLLYDLSRPAPAQPAPAQSAHLEAQSEAATLAQPTPVENPAVGFPLADQIFALPQTDSLTSQSQPQAEAFEASVAPPPEFPASSPSISTPDSTLSSSEMLDALRREDLGQDSDGLPDWLIGDEVSASLAADFGPAESNPLPDFLTETVETELTVAPVDDTLDPAIEAAGLVEKVPVEPTSVSGLDSLDGAVEPLHTPSVVPQGAYPPEKVEENAPGASEETAQPTVEPSFNLFEDDLPPPPSFTQLEDATTASAPDTSLDVTPPAFNLFEDDLAAPTAFSRFEDDAPLPTFNALEGEEQAISLDEIAEEARINSAGPPRPDKTDSYPISLDEIAQQARPATAPLSGADGLAGDIRQADKPITESLKTPAQPSQMTAPSSLYPFELPTQSGDEKGPPEFNYPFELPADADAPASFGTNPYDFTAGLSPVAGKEAASVSNYPFELPQEVKPSPTTPDTEDGGWLPDFLRDAPPPSPAAPSFPTSAPVSPQPLPVETVQPSAAETAQPSAVEDLEWDADLFKAAPTPPRAEADEARTQPSSPFQSADPLDLYEEIDLTMPDDADLDLVSLSPTSQKEETESTPPLSVQSAKPVEATPVVEEAATLNQPDHDRADLRATAPLKMPPTPQPTSVVDLDEADLNRFTTVPAQSQPAAIQPAPTAPMVSQPAQASPKPVEQPPEATEGGAINWVNVGGGAISVDRANVRLRPTFDNGTVAQIVNFGQRMTMDGWADGPELRGSTRWYHIVQGEGGGWIHSTLIKLDQPFQPA